jgi:hypothetical protein
MDYNILFDKILSSEAQFADRRKVGKKENGAIAFSCAPQKAKKKYGIYSGKAPKFLKHLMLHSKMRPTVPVMRLNELHN